ncbi:sulfotransferase 6B1-like [Haliotis rubra]|uniref:sulfotransferase 6B1-like n=1 Tax=Haliotis rubra TaxID=36100 RepID=UPI001EE603F3|nr:sulfotransferase 6B1-like [Haliotis rubra]
MLKGARPEDRINSIKDAELKDDDIIICAYPKCGSHWLWEVIMMLNSGTLQHQKDVKETRMMEFLFKRNRSSAISACLQHAPPSAHAPKQVVEKKIKCIQIMRNPKDTCVSYFNHNRDRTPPYNYEGDFVELTEAFLTEKLPFGSYSTYLQSWKAEVAAALGTLSGHVKDVARFFGLASTDKFCEEVADACSFKKMKKVDQEMKMNFP